MPQPNSHGTFVDLLAALPEAAAEAARIDVASGLPGGERSPEHERTLDLARQLRVHLRRGENTALRALIAIGYDASSARGWLRSDAEAQEPAFQRPDDDIIRIPVYSMGAERRARRTEQAEQEGQAKREEGLAVALDTIDRQFGPETKREDAESE